MGLDCDEAPVGGCVVDCSSRKRFPFERNAWGGRVCPAHAPVRASTCSIDCSALYSDADPNGDYHDCFTCQAGHYCVAHGAYQIESTRCAEIPASCDADPRPVCGQDGQRYANACAMHQARMDFVAYRPRCPDDLPGFFRCGGVYCRVGIEYCDAWKPDEDGRANEYQCRESACANEGGCECLGFDAGTIDDGVDELTCEEDAGRVYVANTTVMYF